MRITFALSAAFALAAPCLAEEPKPGGPPAVPATRAELKRHLEDSKHNQPRLPLPPPTAEELAEAAKRPAFGPFRGIINNGRMRQLYLPREVTSGGFSREPDPAMPLGYPFQTMLFWIVSRANNCTYCMGHQEAKLAAVGLDDDRIAALDGDWSEYDDAHRAAFAFTRKLSFTPYDITDADLDRLRKHYNDAGILEIILSVANFNAMNRWTGALRIPQEEHREYLTPTSSKYENAPSRIAPLDPKRSASAPVCAAPAERPALETRDEVLKALDACRRRAPRLPLVDESKARALLPPSWPAGPVPAWARLLATFPKAGVARAAMHRAADESGTLDPKLRAEIAWVAARNDHAWYALGHARTRLKAFGLSDDAIFALDDPAKAATEGERAVLAIARKLTVDPALIDDADVAALRKHFTDKQTAEVIFQVTEAAFFDRLTEASGLPLEAE